MSPDLGTVKLVPTDSIYEQLFEIVEETVQSLIRSMTIVGVPHFAVLEMFANAIAIAIIDLETVSEGDAMALIDRLGEIMRSTLLANRPGGSA